MGSDDMFEDSENFKTQAGFLLEKSHKCYNENLSPLYQTNFCDH